MQLLDFSAGLPAPRAIRDAGFGGVVGYFSDRRPGAEWMIAKPLRRDYCDSLRAAGLEVVSNYQFGKGATSDWRGGFEAGKFHAAIALRYHFEAGGPGYRPLYAPVDDNPTDAEIRDLVIPFLRGWGTVVGPEWTGVYGNTRTATAARSAGVARWFWIHEWDGVAGVQTPPAWAHMHQIEIDKRKVDGVGVDVNNVLQADYGQWSKAIDGAVPVAPAVPAARKVSPVASAVSKIVQGFKGATHQGIDIAAADNTPIYAVADGEIVEGLDRVEGSVDGFSNWIWQDSQQEFGLDFIYGHMQHAEIFVRAGDRVKAGQLIALVGSEGQSSGPHLHFEAWTGPGRVGGKATDPTMFLTGAAEPTALTVTPPVSVPTVPEGPKPVAAPAFTELDRMGSARSNRFGAKITNILWHTQEGDGTAESLAAYLNNLNNQVSYHYTIRDRIVCDVVDTDYASWSVLDANPYTINYCFAGSRASWSTDRWMQQADDIRIVVWLSLQDCRKYGVSTEIIAPPYRRANGISDHNYVTKVLRIGSHTDVGPNFPWSFAAQVLNEYLTGAVVGPPVNVPNAIAVMREAAPWLGAKITSELELPTPNGRGKYAVYEGGTIYFTNEYGARPVPNHLMETYKELGYEEGPLGFPVNYHTTLSDGDVQAFEKGTLYRKFGQPGFYVTGLIGERWKRSGFEAGPYGWAVANETDFDTGRFQDFDKGRIYWPGKRATVGLLNMVGADTPVTDTEG